MDYSNVKFVQSENTAEAAHEALHSCHLPECNNQITRKDSHSFIVYFRVIDFMQHYWYDTGCTLDHASRCNHPQCRDFNHWSCCKDHAVQVVHTCIDKHFAEPQPSSFLPYKTSTYDVSAYVETVCGTPCAICGVPLTTKAYSYYPAHATTGGPVDGSRFYLSPSRCEQAHWCCSMEHAKLAAHACIEQHVLPTSLKELRRVQDLIKSGF